MTTPEFRVRPVIRHVVTRYTAHPPEAPGCARSHSGQLETLGEFDSEGYADIVSEALRERVAPRIYAIVQETLGEVNAKVFYAYDESEVQRLLFGMPAGESYQVYSRLKQSL